MISVYIPTYNQRENLIKSVESVKGLDVVVVDNNSDMEYDSVLQDIGNRCKVIKNSKNVGRVGNWETCVKHFINSDSEWMKWLFTGDTLDSDAKNIMEDAIKKYPEAKLIAFQHDCDYGNEKKLYSILNHDKLMHPGDAIELTVLNGNWFANAISCLIHKDAVKDFFNFGQIPWVADMQFGLNIITKFPSAYIAKKIGTFNVSSRNYYLKYCNSMWAEIEDYVIRKQAIENYLNFGNDTSKYNELNVVLEDIVLNRMKYRIKNTDEAIRNTDEAIKNTINDKLDIIDQKFEDYNCVNCIIWGAGNGGKYVKDALKLRDVNYNIIGFVDKFKTGTFEGCKIFSIKSILNLEFDYIFIATTPGKIEALDFLKKNSFRKIDDFIDLI